MADRIRVVLVESSFLIQAGIEILIQEMPQMILIESFDGSEKKLSDKILIKKPDVIIINPDILNTELIPLVNKLNKNGICLVGLIYDKTPPNYCSPFTYCLKRDDDKYELLETLKKIAGSKLSKSTKKNSTGELSDREITILKQVVYGLTNQEIADRLFLSIHTITTHRKNITRKLGIKTVSGLTVYALMNKIVDLKDIEQK